MYGCVIENTTGKKSSNAVAITGDARVTIGSDSEGNRSVIRNNSADWGGAVTLSGTSEAVIYDTDIIGNHAKGAGALRVVDNTSLTLTDCVLENNYTTGGNGGALAFESTENCYCNRCHFEGNCAQNEGGAIKVDRSGSIVFLNACTFKGNYNQAKPAGTTIQINNNGYFAMNNCTIADDTYMNSFKGTLDGKFVLFTHNSKNSTLVLDCKQENVARGVHHLRLVVIDACGNETVYEKEFEY